MRNRDFLRLVGDEDQEVFKEVIDVCFWWCYGSSTGAGTDLHLRKKKSKLKWCWKWQLS